MRGMTDDLIDITPEQIAALKEQLKVANARLVSLERERREMKVNIMTLAALLNRRRPKE